MGKLFWEGFGSALKAYPTGTIAALQPSPVMPYCSTHLKEMKNLKKKKRNPGVN